MGGQVLTSKGKTSPLRMSFTTSFKKSAGRSRMYPIFAHEVPKFTDAATNTRTIMPTTVVAAALTISSEAGAALLSGLLPHEIHVALKGHDLASQALHRHLLDRLAPQVHIKGSALCVHKQNHMLACKRLLQIVGLQVDDHASMSIHLACKGLPVYGREPAVGIDLLGKRW